MARSLQARSRRGRRALLWAFTVFVLVQLGGGLVLDYIWPELRFPTAYLTFKALQQQAKAPDVMCLGSSRFGAGFAQEQIRDILREETGDTTLTVFNAAIEAGDLVTADFIMEGVLEQGTKPRVVVIEVSPETLARRGEWMGQHVLRQLTWEDVPEHLGDIWRSGNMVRLLSARLLPLHMHRHEICRPVRDHVAALLSPPKKKGKKQSTQPAASTQGVPWEVFMELDQQVANPAKTSAGLPVIRRWLKNYSVGGGAGRALERLVQRCREEEVQVILVGVPVTEAHRALYTPEIDHAFLARLVDVSRRYHCRFVDYRGRIPDDYFLDNHHLHRSGGYYFSKLLAQETLAPVLLERREMAGVVAADSR